MTEMQMSEYMFSVLNNPFSLLRMRSIYTQLYKLERLKACTQSSEQRIAIKTKQNNNIANI